MTKTIKIEFCKKFIKKFNTSNQKNIYNIVTDDENWLRCSQPKFGNSFKFLQLSENN